LLLFFKKKRLVFASPRQVNKMVIRSDIKRNVLVVTKGHPFDRGAFFAMLDALPGQGEQYTWTHVEHPAATALFREEFDAAWEQGGLWITIWHPFVSGRLGRAAAIVRLIEHMQAKGGVWFAPLAEVAAHVHGLIESGAWTPRVETVPFWENPVPQLVRPVL